MAKGDARNKQDEPSEIVPVLQRIDASAHTRATKEKKHPPDPMAPWSKGWWIYWLTIWIPRTTAGWTAVATVVAASAAVGALLSTRTALVAERRAWVTLGEIKESDVPRPGYKAQAVEIRNFGQGPAIDVKTYITDVKGLPASFPTFTSKPGQEGYVLAPGQARWQDFYVPITIDRLAPPHWIGKIVYRDQFRQRRRTRFCFYLRLKPETEVQNPSGDTKTVVSTGISACDRWNDAK